MTLSDFANIGNLVSSAAVLASVVYLALQTRQSARNQRSLMDRGRSEQVGEWLQFIASADIAPLVMRGHANDPTMTPEERQRYTWCLYPLLLHYEDSLYQHREKMLGDSQFTSIRNQMMDSAHAPGFRAVWKHVRNRFPIEFRSFANGIFDIPETSD